MDCPIFNSPYLGENTLRGYGSFTITSGGLLLPAFHFLFIKCSVTFGAYLINMETGISFKASPSTHYDSEYKAVSGLVESVVDYIQQAISRPEDFSKLVQLNEANEIFWAQYHKIRLLYPEARSRATDLLDPVKSHLLQLHPHISFISFAYQTIGE